MMKRTMVLGGSLALAGLVILAGHSVVQAGPKSKLGDNEIMEALKKYNGIGKAHEVLRKFRGDYEQVAKWYNTPGKKPKEDRCTSTTGWVGVGRFMTQTVKGQWLGVNYEGLMTIGYDYGAEKYVMTWIDSFHTRMVESRGTFDKDSDTFTFEGTFFDAVAGKDRTVKTVMKLVGKRGGCHIELFDITDPKEPFKFFEIDSKRRMRIGA
ncbi:MAG: DUF1579 family protein [Planctomycetes bacterium]|nr:DUF1579 family protein [Planctomycetota bacterium]